jgi:c-di-GMP-binding flagellar brake protein YcgR
MTEPQERRRFPRHELMSPVALRVPTVHDVQLVDISRTGILFACQQPFQVGQRAHIRTLLARQPFTAAIRIVRAAHHPAPHMTGACCFGAVYAELDETSRRNLQSFLAARSRES